MLSSLSREQANAVFAKVAEIQHVLDEHKRMAASHASSQLQPQPQHPGGAQLYSTGAGGAAAAGFGSSSVASSLDGHGDRLSVTDLADTKPAQPGISTSSSGTSDHVAVLKVQACRSIARVLRAYMARRLAGAFFKWTSQMVLVLLSRCPPPLPFPSHTLTN